MSDYSAQQAERGTGDSSALLADVASALVPYLDSPRWLVGYSGGIDSGVLLQLCVDYCASHSDAPPLVAIHVNHRLSADADRWQRHCERQCAALGIPLLTATVQQTTPRGGPEATARRARYAAYLNHLNPGDTLLLAHHQDDQLETLMLQLCRGCDADGLNGIPSQRPLGTAQLLRPLLDTSRVAIQAWAEHRGLCWVEDESNRDEKLDRNYLRHRVLPLLRERWPALAHTASRSAVLRAEERQLREELATRDLAAVCCGEGLAIAALRTLTPARRHNLLRHWLKLRGAPPLRHSSRAQIERAFLSSRDDAMPLLAWNGYQLRRYRNVLYAIPVLPTPPHARHSWQPLQPLRLSGMGQLSARRVQGDGLRLQTQLEVRFRRGGERCHPPGSTHSRPLKKLLQERGMPPWLRERVPLIYLNGQLAAVGDLWVCQHFSADAGEAGLSLSWQPPTMVGWPAPL